MLGKLRIVCAFGCVVGLVLMGACEDEPSLNDVDDTNATTGTPTFTEETEKALYMLPPGANVGTNAGDTVSFKAGGGTAPRTFTLSNGALGSLGPPSTNPDGSTKISYTSAAGSGVNTITVSDSAGATKQATVTHSE